MVTHDCEAVVREAALARRAAEHEAFLLEQQRRADLRAGSRRAALEVVRVVSDGTWRVLAGDRLLGTLTRETRTAASGRRRAVVSATVDGEPGGVRDVGMSGAVRYLAFVASLRDHGSAPCHDESLVDAIAAEVRVEPTNVR